MLRQQIQKKANIVELDIICFEYILLEFAKLIEWIYALDDEFLIKRKEIIVVREKLLEAITQGKDYKDIDEIRNYVKLLDEYNIEQLSAKILSELT